jgi:hypothetical protein
MLMMIIVKECGEGLILNLIQTKFGFGCRQDDKVQKDEYNRDNFEPNITVTTISHSDTNVESLLKAVKQFTHLIRFE